MTKRLLVALSAVLIIGCENLHQTVRSGTILGAAPPGQVALLIGNHAFTDFESVKTYIRALPRGAILYWESRNLGGDMVPLPRADMTVGEFSNFCRQNGVAFVYRDTTPGARAGDVFVLPPSGFANFCEILSSPAMNAVNARQLFAECGVAYADGVQQFFENAGVPFPPKTSVTYSPENKRLIVYNTPANQALISRIVWSYQTPDFDEKMRCLADRMKARRYTQ